MRDLDVKGDADERIAGGTARPPRPGTARGRHAAARPAVRAGRRGHREDPRHHLSDRLRSAHRRLRSAQRHGPDLHFPRGRGTARQAPRSAGPRRGRPHLPRGRAQAAVLLLADGRRRQDPPHRRAQALHGRPGGRAAGPAQRRRVHTRLRLRDRMVAREPHRGGGLPRPRAGRRAHRRRRLSPRGDRQAHTRLRGGQGGPRRHRLRGRPAPAHRRPHRPPRRSADGAPPVPALRRRRIPGRLARPAPPPPAVAGGPQGPVRRGGRLPDHLLLRGGLLRLPRGLRLGVLRGAHRRARPRLPVESADRRLRQRRHRDGSVQGGRQARLPAALLGSRGLPRVRERRRGGRGDRARDPRPARTGRTAGRHGDPLSDQLPVRGVRGGPVRSRDSVLPARIRAILLAPRWWACARPPGPAPTALWPRT